MTTLTNIVTLLSIMRPEYQEQVMISELNNLFNFDHYIYVMDTSADMDRFINPIEQPNYVPQTVCVLKGEYDNITVLNKIESKNPFLIVVLSGNSKKNAHLLTKIKKIKRLNVNLKIGLFYPPSITTDLPFRSIKLKKLFQSFWESRMINIFVAVYSRIGESNTEPSLNVFTFHPFGSFEVVNVSKTYDNLFLSQNTNFQEHFLYVLWKDQYIKKSEGKMWSEIVRVMNASLFKDSFGNKSALTSETYEADVSGQRTPIQFESHVSNGYLYPVRMETYKIAVPEALPYDEFAGYLQTVSTNPFFACSLITIVSVVLLLSFFRYFKQKKFLFFQSAADVANLLMNDNGDINYRRLPLNEVFLIVPLTFVGFVFVNGILSILQSHLTRPVMQPQINTLEEIYKLPSNISVFHEEVRKLLVGILKNVTKLEDWNYKIQVVDESILETQIQTFNTSISFVRPQAYVEHLIKIQKQLNRRGYHITPFNMNKAVLSYIVNGAFPFIDRLDEIISWIKSAGLYEQWRIEDEIIWEKRVIEINIKVPDDTLVEFPIPMFIFYGWGLSIVVCIIEIIWKKFKLYQLIRAVRRGQKTLRRIVAKKN